jgi:hypothetical protein
VGLHVCEEAIVEVAPVPAACAVRDSAPRDLPDVVRAALEESVAAAGATVPVSVEVVERIEREPGTGAKLRLVRSEVPERA